MARYENGLLVVQEPLGHAQVTVSTVAVGLPSIPPSNKDVRRVVIRPLGDAISWRDDGVDPTASTGFRTYADEVVVFDGPSATKVRMIRDSTATIDVDVRVIYYGVA